MSRLVAAEWVGSHAEALVATGYSKFVESRRFVFAHRLTVLDVAVVVDPSGTREVSRLLVA